MFPGGVNYATSRVSILVGRIVGFGIQFLLSDRVSLGREGLIVFAFFARFKSASRLAVSWLRYKAD